MADKTFPLDNRAVDLTVDFFLLRRRIGQELGYGYNHATWDDVQNQEVLEVLDEGLRQYYEPPPLPPPYAITSGVVHEWSFMRPIYKFRTAPNQRIYRLPENFERPIGEIYYEIDEGDYYGPIPFSSAPRLMKLENRQEQQSPPRYAAIKPAESTGETPQEQELVLHPTPDDTYKLQFQYQAWARRLTEKQPYPLGGQTHGAGILGSCLASAEARKLNASGPRYMQFMELLAANIIRDTQRGAAVLGYNGNDRRVVYGRGENRDLGGVFYRDVKYGTYMD